MHPIESMASIINGYGLKTDYQPFGNGITIDQKIKKIETQ